MARTVVACLLIVCRLRAEGSKVCARKRIAVEEDRRMGALPVSEQCWLFY